MSLGPSPPPAPPRPPTGAVVFVSGFLPGALFGTHLAGLLFFLNPDLPFGTLPLLRGVLVYGGLLGLVTLAVSWPFLRRRPRRARRWLPWGLTVALGAAALLDWAHAAHYGFFLPSGINRRLIKAALWLTLALLIAFYTALLHSMARRSYGPRSRWGLVLLVLLSIYVMVERREAFQPGPPASPRPSVVGDEQRPVLLVVGLEGATLDALLPLASQGRLPFVARLVEEGAYGRLGSLSPNRRKALWTTLVTGKYPYKHGLLGEARYPVPLLVRDGVAELLPVGLGFAAWGTLGADPQPSNAADRDVLTLWEILPRLGVGSGVIGWPASDPVSPEPVFAVSERYFRQPSAPGAARPDEVVARARLFRLRPDEVDPLLLAPFGDDRPAAVPRSLAADLSRQSLASLLLQQYRSVEALFLQLDGLAEISRDYLGGYAAVQFEGAQQPGYQQAARWVAAYYAQIDLMLSRLWDRIPPPKLLAVVSPYGTEAPEGVDRLWHLLRGKPLAASHHGSPDGVLLLYGTGVAPGVLLTGAELVDVTPTLLYGAGLPVARDLDGQVLTTAYDRAYLASHPLTFLPSYETLEEGR